MKPKTLARLTITEVSNINWDKMAVINNNAIETVMYNVLDKVTVYDKKSGETEETIIDRISLYDHYIHKDGKQYKVLHMLTKSEALFKEDESTCC